jgi:hypothetical protein
VDETQWEAELQLRDIGGAAETRVLEAALLLVAQSPPGERRFPTTVTGVQNLVESIAPDRFMVDVSVVGNESEIHRDAFHLWITPNADGSLRLELVSGKQPGFEYDHVLLNLWADGEVGEQSAQGSVDMEEIRAEEQRTRELLARQAPEQPPAG